jgi:UDP:flavonoid glycosyltransferase YjiC (YdhE family)
MPLRILLAAIGSSGDVNPVLGLGKALKARGHQVSLATNEIFEALVRESGLEFIELGTRREAEAMMGDPRLWHRRRGFHCIVEGAILPNLPRLYRIIEERQGPRLVVAATTLCLGARVAQDRFGVPTATLNLQPSVFRSLVDNGTLGGLHMGPGMPKLVKKAVFWAIDTLYVERHVGRPLNRFRSGLGLAAVSGVFASYIHSPQLVLGLFPEWFAPVQPDWPGNTHLTGFILEDAGGDAGAHAEADRFLDSGPAPVLVTPGSAAMDRTRFFGHLVEACRAVGARAMLVTNHPAQLPRTLTPGIQANHYLPFSRVMPRCAVAVYHGGIGTLAQAVRAGVPHLVVANAHDQPDNGQRIERIGLGLALDEHRLSSRSATRALAELVASGETRRRCRELAPRIRPEEARLAACSRIEALAQQEPA